MKPGGLCSPGDGRALPPGDGVGAAPLPHKLSDACAQFSKGPATPREGRACLTPDLFEEGSQGTRPTHSPLNGHLSQESLLNGVYEAPFSAPRECHVLSPPQSEDGDEDGAHPCPAQCGVGFRPGGMRALGTPVPPAALPPTLPNICGKRYEQLTVITADSRGRGGPSTTDPAAPCPGSSSLASPGPGQQGAGPARGAALTSPKGCKSQRGRRKCSLEEVMTKLYSRRVANIQAGANALMNFPSSSERLPEVQQGPSVLGEGGCDGAAAPPGRQLPLATPTCDKSSAAPSPGTHPGDQAARGPGLRTSRQDSSPGPPSVRTPSVVSDSLPPVTGAGDALPSVAATGSVVPDAGGPGRGSPPPTPREDPPQGTVHPTEVDRHPAGVPDEGDVRALAVLNPTVSPERQQVSPSTSAKAPVNDGAVGKASTVPVRSETGDEEREGCVVSPVEEPGSGRSSSVEVLEAEGGSGSRGSESDIEVLFDGTGGGNKDTTTTTSVPLEKEGKCTTRKETDAPRVLEGQGSTPSVLPGRGEPIAYLEPISDDENSLLTSDLSSASGALSNSNTPMFSDTPSDASRGALMVKISDAVAAILSDVSDESLPDSPSASSSNSADGFPSTHHGERLSRKISSICEKLEEDCRREGPATATSTQPPPRAQERVRESVTGVISDIDSRTNPQGEGECPQQPLVAQTVFPSIQKQAGLSLIPCVALSSSSSSSLCSSPLPPSPSSPPLPPQPPPQSTSPPPPSSSSPPPPPPQQTCKSVSSCDIPVRRKNQQLQEVSVPSPSRDSPPPDTLTTTPPSPPPLPQACVEGVEEGQGQQEALLQSDTDERHSKEEGTECVDLSDPTPESSSSAPAHPCTLSPDIVAECPSLSSHVPHNDLGTNYYNRSRDDDNNSCQNHFSGSQTVSSQTRFCNILPGDGKEAPAGMSSPASQAEVPQGPPSPSPDPVGSTTQEQDSPQKPDAPENREVGERHTHPDAEGTLCDTEKVEVPTIQPGVSPCTEPTRQESAVCPSQAPAPPTTITQHSDEQSSSKGRLPSSCESNTTITPPVDTPPTSDTPQKDVSRTEAQPSEHIEPVECPVKSSCVVEAVGAGGEVISPVAVRPIDVDQPKCIPPDCSQRAERCETDSLSNSESHALLTESSSTPDDSSSSTSSVVLVEEKEGGAGEGCSLAITRATEHTQVPRSVAMSPTQHPATSPHTPHVTPVPLTCPAMEEPTGPGGGLQDPGTSSTSASPVPVSPPDVPGAPQALCSLGEATTQGLLVSRSPGAESGVCEPGESTPCTSLPAADSQSLASPTAGEGKCGDGGSSLQDPGSDGGELTSPQAEAEDITSHSPSVDNSEVTPVTPQPDLLAILGLERCWPQRSTNTSTEDNSVPITQPLSTTQHPPEVLTGQVEVVGHQDTPTHPTHPSDHIPTAVGHPQTVVDTLPHQPDSPATLGDIQTPIPMEEIHHPPHNTTTTQLHPKVEGSQPAECDMPVRNSPATVPMCASLPHTTAPHTPGEATVPTPALRLPEEHLRDSIECTFHEAKTRPATHLPGDLPSVKSPTVGVTPDEVTIPQGEPHTGLTSEHLSPPTCAAQGIRTPTPTIKDEVKSVSVDDVILSEQCQEEGQTVCRDVTQATHHATTATDECVHTAIETTTSLPIITATTDQDFIVPQQPQDTEAVKASSSATDSGLQQREAVEGELEGLPQLNLDLVKREEVTPKQEPGRPSHTGDSGVTWLPERLQGKPVSPAGETDITGTLTTSPQEAGHKEEATEVLGVPCPLCCEVLDIPLKRHITSHHVCCTFVPAKTTFSYQRHMLLRVTDAADLPGEDHYPDSLFVCRSCCFASHDINAVRFHLNIHEEVYQVRPGQVDCDCDRRTYSFPSHKWKSLIHRSSHHCHLCGHYFACHEGHRCHTLAMHFPGQHCQVCGCQVPPEEACRHLANHQTDPAAPEMQQDAEASASPGTSTSSPADKFGISWNIYDNWINFLDGKDFRLSTAPKVPDPQLDRSYLSLPLCNVDDEAVVPDEAIMDPAQDIHRYLKGKRVVRLPGGGEETLRSFSVAVQLELHKKMNRKGRKCPADRPRGAQREDIFAVLGILGSRTRATVSKEAANSPAPNTPGRKPRRKLSLEIPLDDPSGSGPQLTRTRSGMMQPPRGETSGQNREDAPPPASRGVAVVDGEWSKEHTYVCCSCGVSCLNLADMMDHKWEMHPAVWCAHTMLEGQGLVPHGFRYQFQPPTTRPCILPLPGTQTPNGEEQSVPGAPHIQDAATRTCTSCHSTFQDMNAFHAHLVECGGLSLLSFSKKKTKKGFRFKRRKGQGMPTNRYGNASQPSTPLKARAGDRSSGLNTPLSDRPQALGLTTCGVKRRLELAVGSIDNVELKNRLKAIITNTRGPPTAGTSHPGRRPTKMKLRKKALDTRRLRKTRHSDRVKEQRTEKDEKVEVSGEESKGKTGKKTSPTETPKPVKGKEGKTKGKKSKKKSAKGEEESQEAVSGPSGTVSSSDVEEKKKVKIDAATDTDALPVTEKQQRVNGFLSNTKKKKKTATTSKPQVLQVADNEEKTPPETPSTDTTPAPPLATEKKGKGKKGTGKRKTTQDEGVTEENAEKPVKGTKKMTKTVKSEKRQLEGTEAPAASPSPSQPPQEPTTRPRKVRRTSSVETNASSVKEEEEEEAETTFGDEEEEEEEEEEVEEATEDSEWNSDSKDQKSRVQDALRPKRQSYFTSSSEDTENSDDSEPEVIRNFRSGRRCSGRTGLRNKRTQANSRYAFRTCFSASTRKKDSGNGAEKDGEKRKKMDFGDEEEDEAENDEEQDLPLTPRRKRKVANYENQDDYTYMPNESSSDVDYMEEVSEDEAPVDPERESPRPGRSKRRSIRLSSKTSSSSRSHTQKEDEGTTGEGTEAGDNASILTQDVSGESPKQEVTQETPTEEPVAEGKLGEGVLESPNTWTPASVCASARGRRRSLEVPRETGTKVQKVPRTASAPSSDLEGDSRCASKVPKRKGVALLERLALSSSFQAQVDEVAGKTQRRKKVTPSLQSDFKDTDEECAREATPGRDEESAPKALRRKKYLLSENSASDSQALESDSSMEKVHQPLGRRRNVIVSSDCSEAEAQPAAPPKNTSDPETLAEDTMDDMPLSLAKKMRAAKRNQSKTTSDPPREQGPGTPVEEDDEEDNVPLSTLAHLNKKHSTPSASLAPGKLSAAAERHKKVSGKSKKRLKVRQLNRLIKESAAQDSESSSFEGFSSTPPRRWSKAKASSKKYKKKLSLLKVAKPFNSGSTASESEASDDPRAARKTKKLGASPLTTATPDTTITATTRQTEAGARAAPPKKHSKAPASHKKGKSNKKHKKAGGKAGKAMAGTDKVSLKGSVGPPQTMPVLECMVDVKDSQGEPHDATVAPDIPEPAGVQHNQVSVEPPKDIPVVPPTQQPPELLPATSDSLEGQATPSSTPLPQDLPPPPVESPSKPPQPRKKRAKSSQEAAAKDKGSGGGESLPPPPPPTTTTTTTPPSGPQGHSKTTEAAGSPKKVGKRKRLSSVSGAAGQDVQETSKTLVTPTSTTTTTPAATTTKKNSDSVKKKKSSSTSRAAKAEVNELTCVECGLKFGSVASLEDHRQDCLTIAFEMSMMEAEDHLFECPHCHLTFAKKGTQRKHTTSCRLVKYKRYESKSFKKASRCPPTAPALLLPGGDTGVVPPAPLPSPGKGSKSSKENISAEVLPGAPDPVLKEVLRVPVYTRNSDKMGTVLVGGNTLQENIKNLEPLQRVAPLAVADTTTKARRESQLNGRLLNGEHQDPFPTTPTEEPPRCGVCGYETSDPDVLAKHRLILHFSRCCQQQTVREVCALAANYNLGLDVVRGMVSAATTHQAFITLAFDPKQPPVSTLSPLVGAAASTTAKLKEVLASPHCAWVLSSLESLAKHYQTSDAVNITGSRQDTLKTVSILEEVLKDISETDNALLRNRMLKSMRETFEAGTLN